MIELKNDIVSIQLQEITRFCFCKKKLRYFSSISIDTFEFDSFFSCKKNYHLTHYLHLDFDLNKSKKLLKQSFLYCDPPYLPEDDILNKKQELYTKDIFVHEEFVRNLDKLTSVNYMVSMTDSKIANSIYGSLRKYTAKDLIRTINPQKSFISKELIFSNYVIENKEIN